MIKLLKNAGVRGIPGGAVALVEDEERDVPQPEDAVAEVIKKDLWRHDEHLGPVDPAAPGVRVPEVDAHVAVELGDAEVRVLLDDARLLVHEHDGGDEEDGEGGRRGGADAVCEAAEKQHRNERLAGARLEEHKRVPGQRALQRLQLVPSRLCLRVAGWRQILLHHHLPGGFGGGAGHGDEDYKKRKGEGGLGTRAACTRECGGVWWW